MRQCFVEREFRAGTLAIIDQANAIISEYEASGYGLTLRQLYYQFVARDKLPNTQRSYDRLGSIVNDGRLAGLIDWDAIEDRTRNLTEPPTWSSPESIARVCAEQFRSDVWARQESYVECWVEKEALAGVVAMACEDLEIRVPYFSCRGYVSQSEMYGAAQRIARKQAAGKRCVVLHLGDHDPSGIDMTRDISNRLGLLGSQDVDPAGYPVEVQRIALNMDQVEQYGPPPNPAKITDSRFTSYLARYGDQSWELDALEPSVLVSLIRENVLKFVDADAWAKAERRETTQRKQLARVAANWAAAVRGAK